MKKRIIRYFKNVFGTILILLLLGIVILISLNGSFEYGNNPLNINLEKFASPKRVQLRNYQSNHEGELIDALQKSQIWANGVVFNPGGYTHTSVAIRDAISAISVPVVEVHISNVAAREDFRKISVISDVAIGSITGFGWKSYLYGIQALIDLK